MFEEWVKNEERTMCEAEKYRHELMEKYGMKGEWEFGIGNGFFKKLRFVC
jgi:hypothetical protein